MSSKSTASALAALVGKMQAERQAHMDAIKSIDEAFKALGLRVPRSIRPAANGAEAGHGVADVPIPASVGRTRGYRGSYAQTADQFIVALLTAEPSLTSTEINQRWRHAGRGGTADNTLSRLTHAGVLLRENIKGTRGSHYRLAASSTA